MRGRPLYEPLILREDVKLEELAQIEARRELFSSVEVQESARRHYPQAGLFAHTLGIVGQVSETQLTQQPAEGALQSGDIVGKSGVEKAYDQMVRGMRGWKLVSVNNLGRRVGPARVSLEPDHGAALDLTLDISLQVVLRQGFAGEAGAGVFMDPSSGEILAMVSSPTFDPNHFADGISHDDWQRIANDPQRPLHDRSIASFYAPGSTFKVMVALAGLETGAAPLEETVYCRGSAVIYDRPRLCWKRGGHGRVDLRKALAESCNVYFYTLGKKLGIDSIHHYGSLFGLGAPTGIDLPGEERGIMPSRDWKQATLRERWYPGDTISVAIGQGYLAVTPMQLVRMISGVATDGWLPTPHLLKGNASDPVKLPISKETLRQIKLALEDAVSAGTATRAGLRGISVAGKTGTAQVYKHSAGVDSDKLPKPERDHAWFVGYAPAEKPQIAFALVVEHGGHGGASAAPIVRDVLEVFFENEAKRAEQNPDLMAEAGREAGETGVPAPSSR